MSDIGDGLYQFYDGDNVHLDREKQNMYDKKYGCAFPGKIGKYKHFGDPLTVSEIESLKDGDEVIITWSGGNGPHKYKILVDKYGEVRVDNTLQDNILIFNEQMFPIHRVTKCYVEPVINPTEGTEIQDGWG